MRYCFHEKVDGKKVKPCSLDPKVKAKEDKEAEKAESEDYYDYSDYADYGADDLYPMYRPW